jgi:hypothetical protein
VLLSNHTRDIRWRSLSERESINVIDPLPYIGADTIIARDIDKIITFASPRNSTAQLSIIRPDRSGSLHPSISIEVDEQSVG